MCSSEAMGLTRSCNRSSCSDDVEEETRGLETFFSSGLAPRRELRVVNADED